MSDNARKLISNGARITCARRGIYAPQENSSLNITVSVNHSPCGFPSICGFPIIAAFISDAVLVGHTIMHDDAMYITS